MGLARPEGALVVSVSANSPAAVAGVKSGDLIVSLDGQAVEDPSGFGFRLATKPLGGHSPLGIVRGGKSLTLTLSLSAPPEIPAREAVRIAGQSPFAGAELMNISPAVVDELSLRTPDEGVVVADVADGSIAAEVGLHKGDVLVEVNGKKISATHDVVRAAAERPRYWDLTVLRDGQVIRSQIGG